MNINETKQWKKDIDDVLSVIPELETMAGKTVMITGATGLICSAVVDVLAHWNGSHDEKINIIAAGRSEDKIKARFCQYIGVEWFSFLPYDAAGIGNVIPEDVDYIIHGASNASPNHIVKEPVETMLANFNGIKELLDYSREQHTKRVLYISTSEVYGRKDSDQPSKVNDYGGIDILNPRSSYSVSKCAAETLCSSFYDEYGVDSVIVRPGHIYGPTAQETDNRVSSAWAYAVAKGEDIVMKSDGAQIRSYCYCLDCASAILKALLNGEPVRAYNISNPNSIINIKQMAELLAESAGVELRMELPTAEERKGFNPMSNSSLDSTELLELGWKGLFDAETGFSHTVSILREMLGR